jgi:DNA-binding PadR family transcriptional regulator
LLLVQPGHGYDLGRHFSSSTALGDIIHLSPSHLYALLGRLERDGLIEGQREEAGNRPQRRVYRLTESGRAAIECWAREPVSHPRDMRIDFPLKLFVARRLGADRASALIERQRSVFEDYIARLEGEEKPAATQEDAAFIELMRFGRIGRARAALEWLERAHGSPLS